MSVEQGTTKPLRASARAEAAGRAWFDERLAIWALALLLLAAAPRTLGLADFFTIDEAFHWVDRVEAFSKAVADRDWDETNITGHPGVTTMWLGSLGHALAQVLGVTRGGAAGGAEYLALLRLPLALANSLAVAVGFLLLRRLLAAPTALLAALLWALDPFLIAHGRLLHLDALLASLLALSLLLLLAAYLARGPREPREHLAFVVASGLLAGLALVTKAPSLLWLPLAGLLLLLLAPPLGLRARIAWACSRYALWLAAALVAAFLAWPALWVAPGAAVGAVIDEIVRNGGQPHQLGNFFLGRMVEDPGPLFYLVAAAFRLAPLTLLGLLLLPLVARALGDDERRRQRALLLALVAFVACFTLALTLQPKKFDRYLLPVFPALDILAAYGLIALARRRVGGSRLVLAVSLVLSLGTLAWYHSYYLAYYNPLLGGGPVAQRALLVGWGEGMEEVGAWLSTRPDLDQGGVIAGFPPTLEPFVAAPVYDLRAQSLALPLSYGVRYSSNVQRDMAPEALAAIGQSPALHTVERHGIVYATIHQLIRPFERARPARFGDHLRLNGFTLARDRSTLAVTPSWSVREDTQGGRFLFLHLLDAQGQRVAQLDAPIDGGLFAAWQAGQQFGAPLPLALPEGLSPGRYRLVLGVYDPADGARLRLAEARALPEAVDGPHALLLDEIVVD